MAGMLFGRIIDGLGGTVTDVNADINDFNPGLYMTYGKVNSASSIDDWFHGRDRQSDASRSALPLGGVM